MALTLNTNIDSLTAQNNLSGSQALLSQSLTRLSSGLRINSAADDAAGLAISQQFTAQINGTNQAISNANNAISEAQTAGGALTTLVNNLQSIRTLAVEAANGSNSASDRAALNAQVQQQIAEISRIASQTSFNGASVLNGTAGTTVYQVGANVGNTISVNLSQGVGANQIGQYATQTGAPVTSLALTSGQTFSITDGAATATVGPSANYVGASATYQGADSAYAKAGAINGAGLQGLTASAATTATDSGAFGTITTSSGVGATASTYALSINGTTIYSATGNGIVAVGSTLTGNQVAQQINLYTNTTGVTASINSSNALVLSNSDGSNISVTQNITLGATGTGAAAAGTGASATIASTTGKVNYGNVTLTDSKALTLTEVGTAGAIAAIGFTATGGVATVALGTTALSGQNVSTVANANSTISSVDSALATVSAFQSQLGAIQNRFTSAVQNLTSTSQNLTQSRSTIVNANFAQETANLTQSQVLEQAGISVLAQANAEPQLILKLIP